MRACNRQLVLNGFRVFIRSQAGVPLSLGCLSAFYILAVCHQFTANLGSALALTTATGLALALGVALGLRRVPLLACQAVRGWCTAPVETLLDEPAVAPSEVRSQSSGASLKPPVGYLFLQLGLAVWMVALPWLMELVVALCERIPVTAMASPVATLLFAVPAALLVVGTATFWIARLPVCLHRRLIVLKHAEPQAVDRLPMSATVGFYSTGVVLGLLADVFLLAPVAGVSFGGLLAAFFGGCLFLFGVIRHAYNDGTAGLLPSRVQSFAVANTLAPIRLADSMWAVSVIGCCGVLIALVCRMVHQLMPVASFLVYTEWAALLAGVTLGWFWTQRPQAARLFSKSRAAEQMAPGGLLRDLQGWSCLGAAASSVGVLAAFPWLIWAALVVNSHVSHVWLLMAIRGLFVAVAMLPIGIAWGLTACVPNRLDADGLSAGGLPRFYPLALVGGFFFVRWIGLPSWGVVNCLIVASWLLVVLAIVGWLQARHLPRGWLAKGLATAAVCLIAGSPLLRGMYDPAKSAKLLFATNVFMAYRSGLNWALLEGVDEGRNLVAVEGHRDTYTIWKYRGAQYQLRSSGVPRAVISTDDRYCPQYSADVMPSVMPLVLHEHPHRVLLLGLGGGISVTTCLSFPVQELTCAEADPRLFELVRDRIWPDSRIDPLADGRFLILQLDPALAVLCGDRHYDVIISSPDQSALMQATAYFTVEFYRRVARRLSADGIFCQRFQQIDFGPAPLQVAAKTLGQVFGDVTAVETAPGEMVLIGTNSAEGLIRGDLVARLQAPHVRRVLSRIGWDWSVLLNLSAYDNGALAGFAQDGAAGVNSARNGRFAFHLPQEVMRWGMKREELQQQLSQRRGRFLEWVATDNERTKKPELLRRLAEVAGQRKLMVDSPDEWWRYRRTVRDQLRSHPRTLIQQVRYAVPKRRLHPEDERRMRYFAALSDASKQNPARNEDIRRVAAFAKPYDPLISYFLHQEVAELYARAADRNFQAELTHRLHAIYFSHAHDRSVRNVAAAVRLLVEHPETVPEPAERWDQLNGLLGVLKTRWDARIAVTPTSSQLVLADIQKSLTALESSFEVMDEFHRQYGIGADVWEARKSFLERVLVRPLRTYRSKILPHHRRRRQRAGSTRVAD